MVSNLSIAESIVFEEIDDQRRYWRNMGAPVTHFEEFNGFVFAVFHSSLNNGMHRYGMYCIRGTTVLYSDSNVIDEVHVKTLQDVKANTKAYFKHYLSLLEGV